MCSTRGVEDWVAVAMIAREMGVNKRRVRQWKTHGIEEPAFRFLFMGVMDILEPHGVNWHNPRKRGGIECQSRK